MTNATHHKHIRAALHTAPATLGAALAVVAMLLLTASCRRDLYVFGDEFHSVTLDVDWREFDSSDPDGMTVWFYKLDDPEAQPFRTTTANVRRQDLYLSNATYQGVVVSYSPEEYSRQTFADMADIDKARVEATPAPYQPADLTIPGVAVAPERAQDVKAALYGHEAWNDHQPRSTQTSPAYYLLANQPEDIGADTIDHRDINAGTAFDDYILLRDRDTYQSSIIVQDIHATPHSLIYTMRVRVYIKEGFNSLWTTMGSITGLADGHHLPWHVNTEAACLLAIDEWQTERTGQNEGWVNTTLTTFGLRPSTIHPFATFHPSAVTGISRYDGRECDIDGYYTDECGAEDLRLNLAFILRDQQTVCTYHFNVGQALVSYDDQLVLRVELDADFLDNNGGQIILPFVEGFDGAGFGADVTPWQDVPSVDVTM